MKFDIVNQKSECLCVCVCVYERERERVSNVIFKFSLKFNVIKLFIL